MSHRRGSFRVSIIGRMPFTLFALSVVQYRAGRRQGRPRGRHGTLSDVAVASQPFAGGYVHCTTDACNAGSVFGVRFKV